MQGQADWGLKQCEVKTSRRRIARLYSERGVTVACAAPQKQRVQKERTQRASRGGEQGSTIWIFNQYRKKYGGEHFFFWCSSFFSLFFFHFSRPLPSLSSLDATICGFGGGALQRCVCVNEENWLDNHQRRGNEE